MKEDEKSLTDNTKEQTLPASATRGSSRPATGFYSLQVSMRLTSVGAVNRDLYSAEWPPEPYSYCSTAGVTLLDLSRSTLNQGKMSVTTVMDGWPLDEISVDFSSFQYDRYSGTTNTFLALFDLFLFLKTVLNMKSFTIILTHIKKPLMNPPRPSWIRPRPLSLRITTTTKIKTHSSFYSTEFFWFSSHSQED